MRITARVRETSPDRDRSTGTAPDEWTETLDIFGDVDCTVQRAGTTVTAIARADVAFPFFGWIFRPLMRSQLRRVLRARLHGEPVGPLRPWWGPPSSCTAEQTRVIAVVCGVFLLVGFSSSLLTQTASAVADAFGLSNSGLSFLLGVTRLGILLALAGAWFSDRAGRRRVLIVATLLLLIASAASALSPNATVFFTLQVVVRALVNLVGAVAGIMLIEEAPERARAWAVSMGAVAGGTGFALSTLLLPLLDVGPEAWRALYALSLVFLAGWWVLLRQLPESHRFRELRDRGAHTGRIAELVDRRHARRFAVLVASAFLLNLSAAPSSQLITRYLQEGRGFSGTDVLLLRTATQSVIVLAAVVIGGRIADRYGRLRLFGIATVVAAITGAAFFLTAMPWLAPLLLVSTSAGALGGPAWGAVNTELFPTEIRGTSSGGLLVAGVAGGVTGLAMTGVLATSMSIGAAIAVTNVGPLIVVFFLLRFLPESGGHDLDEISPNEE
jgi:MFS family permease